LGGIPGQGGSVGGIIVGGSGGVGIFTNLYVAGGNGVPNTGSGGGGGGSYNGFGAGSGGSGRCIIKISNPTLLNISTVISTGNSYNPVQSYVNQFQGYVSSYNSSSGAITIGSITNITGYFSSTVAYNINLGGITPIQNGYGFSNIITLSRVSSNQTWTIPSYISRFKVTVIGGGASGCNYIGPGGGGGAIAIKYYTVVPGISSATYTVGAFGKSTLPTASATLGSAGGATSFTYNLTTISGGGGLPWNGVVDASPPRANISGVAAGGDINIDGWPGPNAAFINGGNTPGPGANTLYGCGGVGVYYNAPTAGTGYGAGGGSGGAGASSPLQSGAGAPGAIIIEY